MSRTNHISAGACCVALCAICSSCGPTRETWHLAALPDPSVVPELEMVAATQPAAPATRPATLPTSRPAAQEMKLNLADVRSMALRNNLDLQVTVYDPQIARQGISAEEAKFESTFVTDASTSVADPAQGTGQVNTTAVRPGVQIPLRTGGTVNLSSMADYTTPYTADQAYGSDVTASISQPLLRNAGQVASEFSIRIAGYDYEISRAQTRLEVTRVLAAVDRVYWRLYASRRLLDVAKQQYDLAQELLQRARRMVAAGAAAQIEITRAESGVADRLESVISADNLVRERERELKRLLCDPAISEETVLVPSADPRPIHYRADPSLLLQTASHNRSEILQEELRIARDATTIAYARNQMLPLLSAAYTYRLNGVGSMPGDAYDVSFRRNYQEHILGLRLEIPIGNEAARSRLRQAMLARMRDLSSKSAQENQIHKEVLDAIDQLDTSWQRILASRSRTILAARVLEAEQHQFLNGQQTATDVLDAQTKLAEAQASEISAVTDYQIAQIDLAFATGTVLGQAKVDWQTQIPTTLPAGYPR